MSETAHHHTVHPDDMPTDAHFGRATPGRIAMWIFLLSDLMSFSGFLIGYSILRASSNVWRHADEPVLGINFTAGLAFLLICSSITMVMAYAAVVEKKSREASFYLGLTILGGLLFLCGQMQEYFGTFSFLFHHEGLIAEGLIFGKSFYASTFYIITAFHGMHVLAGVIYLTFIFINSLRGKYDDGNYNEIEIAGLFWHFVDLVWILVFAVVYLVPIE